MTQDVLSPAGTEIVLISPTGSMLPTPPTLAIVIVTYAPTVNPGVFVTPSTLAHILATFAPTVAITANTTVNPVSRPVVLVPFAPTVITGMVVTPTTAALVTAFQDPTVTATTTVFAATPDVLELSINPFKPSVFAGKIPGPTTLALVLATFAPTVTATTNTLVTPTTLAHILTTYAPSVMVSFDLAVREEDGSPSEAAVGLIVFPNGSLSNPAPGEIHVEFPQRALDDLTNLTDGARTNFPTLNYFDSESTRVYHNGLILRPTTDYTEDSALDAVTLTFTPALGDQVLIDYEAQAI